MCVEHFTANFSYDAASNVMITEASELSSPLYGPLYQDAADVGFKLISHLTGRSIDVYLDEELTRRSPSGAIVMFGFRPCQPCIPQVDGMVIYIVND